MALVDVRMPKLGGIELTRRAQRSVPETAILLYTGYGDRALLTEALDAGVKGFVLKEAPMDDLLRRCSRSPPAAPTSTRSWPGRWPLRRSGRSCPS